MPFSSAVTSWIPFQNSVSQNIRGCPKSKMTSITTEVYSVFFEALKVIKDALREGPAKSGCVKAWQAETFFSLEFLG
jgi:hypothetical protein